MKLLSLALACLFCEWDHQTKSSTPKEFQISYCGSDVVPGLVEHGTSTYDSFARYKKGTTRMSESLFSGLMCFLILLPLCSSINTTLFIFIHPRHDSSTQTQRIEEYSIFNKVVKCTNRINKQ